MIKPHLYILSFNDNEHFKLGISIAPNQNRINKHISTYGIDVSKSLIISCDDKNSIKLLEKNLKHITPEAITNDSPYYGLDGYTEIRKNEQLEEVINIIEMFKPILGLKVEELKVVGKPITIKNEPKPNKFEDYDNEKSFNMIDYLVRELLDYLTNVETLKCIYTKDEYLEVTADLSNKFNTYDEVFEFLKPVETSFDLTYNIDGSCRGKIITLNNSGDFIINSRIKSTSDFKNVKFSFRRYFPYRNLDLVVNENDLKKPINVIMDDYDKLMELLIDTYKNKII